MSALALLPADPSSLDAYSDPGWFVEQALTRSKTWLLEAIEHGEIEHIHELKSKAEAIRCYAAQKQLGKDVQLNAAEIVRRAERGLGVCIRRGQAEGTVAKKGDHKGNQHTGGRSVDDTSSKVTPSEYVTGYERVEVYAMTDDVTDEQFEEAIAEARAEKNLARANVVRKVAKRKIIEAPPTKKQRHEVLRKARHVNPDRVVDGVVTAVLVPVSTFDLLNGRYGELDGERLDGWASSLTDSIRSLTTLRNNLKKELASRGEQ